MRSSTASCANPPLYLFLFVITSAATRPEAKLDVGILLSGRFDHMSGAPDFARQHNAVVEALASDGASFATAFCYPMDQPAGAAAAALASAAGLNVVLTHTNATVDADIRAWYPMQFQRLDQCFLALEAWGRRHGRSFSHYIRLRPDTVWVGPMNRVSALPHDAISLRARELYANYTLPHDALSSAWNTWCTKRQYCGPSSYKFDGFGKVKKKTKELTEEELGATFDPRPGYRPCMVPDDQWAVIPAHLTPVYFNTSRRTAPRPEHSPSSVLPPDSKLPGAAQEDSYYVLTASSSSRPPRCAAPNCYKYFETRTPRGELWGEGYLATRLYASEAGVKLAVVAAPVRLLVVSFTTAKVAGVKGGVKGDVRSCNVECAAEWELAWWKAKSERVRARLRRSSPSEALRRTERCPAPHESSRT